MKIVLTTLLLATLAVTGAHGAESPTFIPFQGRITDQVGSTYTNGQYTILFQLYNQAVGGTAIWQERHDKVGVVNGLVNVFLGSITPLADVHFDSTKHLGITIDADGLPSTPEPEMVPRQMIIPAFWAKNSEKLAGYDWSDITVGRTNNPREGRIRGNAIEAGGITTLQVASGAITGSQLASGAVTAAAIANGAIGGLQLADGAVGSQHIVTGSVQTVHLADKSVTYPKLGLRETRTNSVGVGGVAVSDRVGYFEAASDTPVDVTNLVVSIRTVGRPVKLMLIADSITPQPLNTTTRAGNTIDASASNGLYCNVGVVADGSRSIGFGSMQMFNRAGFNVFGVIAMPPSGFQFVDFPEAGPHTYKVQIWRYAGYGRAFLENVRLVAYEL